MTGEAKRYPVPSTIKRYWLFSRCFLWYNYNHRHIRTNRVRKIRTMTTNTIASRPIPSAHIEGKIYLQLFCQETEGLPVRLKVIPTEHGRERLDQFWPVWLRQMILHKTRPEELFSVEIQNKYVLISGGKSHAGLEATVAGLAAQIRPLSSVLARDDDTPEHTVRWQIKYKQCYVPIGMMVAALKIPPGVSLSFESWPRYDDYPTLLSVSCRHNDRRSLRELRLNIEMQVALMCE